MIWESPKSDKTNGEKQDEQLKIYSRKLPKPFSKEIGGEEYDYHVKFSKIMRKMRIRKFYDIKDIKNELEEITEDESELNNASAEQQDKWMIKKKIKTWLKTKNMAPPTEFDFFKYGRVLGKGAYGKINICLQKLSGKLCAVKSINLCKVDAESAI